MWPVDWHTPVSLEPPTYAFSCEASAHGTGIVLASRAFVVNFIPGELEATIMAAGALSGRDGNKRSRLGLDAVPCQFVAAPRLAIASGWLECVVRESHPIGSRVLVVGEVKHAAYPPPGPTLHHEWRA